MKRLMCAALFVVAASATTQAQATQNSTIVWDQAAPDLATALSYTYKHFDDGSGAGVAYTGVQCVASTAGFTCNAPLGAYTAGTHSIKLTAGNAAGDSAQSAPFTFTFVVVPGTPSNLRLGAR